MSTTSNFPKAIFLMGPTASGKTRLAVELCKLLPIELISVDSALIYKGMDVGTAKPNQDVLCAAPHRLLNILDPIQVYSVANFCQDALAEMSEIVASGRIPLLVGGTMLYFKTLLKGFSCLPPGDQEIRSQINQHATQHGWNALHEQLSIIDPISASKIHPNDRQRISRALEVFLISGKTLTELTQIPGKALQYQLYQFAVYISNRELLYKSIEKRFYQMLALGFEAEVRTLFSRGDLHEDLPSMRCVGYRQMWAYLMGKISYNEMVYRSIYATKQLAKRQITWLRNWQGIIHWLDNKKPEQAIDKIIRVIQDTIIT